MLKSFPQNFTTKQRITSQVTLEKCANYKLN